MKRLSYCSFFAFLFLISCSQSSEESSQNLLGQAETAFADQNFESAKSLALQSIDDNELSNISKANAHYIVARTSALTGDFEMAVSHGEPGARLARELDDYELEYKLNNTLSWSYFELGRGFSETKDHQQRQLEVVEQMNDEGAKALVYNNYGYDATVAGQVHLSEALDYVEKANTYYARNENNNGRWYTLMNLTWQHRLLGNLQKSVEYGRLSAAQAEADDDRHAIVESIANLGETLLMQEAIEEATPLYQKALDVASQENDRDKYVYDVYYARYLWESGQKDKAIETLEMAISFLVTSEIFYEMLGRALLAEFSFQQGDIEKAKSQIEVFNNPRASYISQEARVMAIIVESKILELEGASEQASKLIEEAATAVDQSGAVYLRNLLTINQ